MANALNGVVANLRSTLLGVDASSGKLAAAAHSIASNAQQQAASLEEITATVRQTADNAKHASQLAATSWESAESDASVVFGAVSAMKDIDASSGKISNIIATIDEIAFQTNLLAVNAAVEPARPGEEGRGFAVNAAEVRGPALRSAAAAKQITALIQDSLDKVEKGTGLVNKSGENLKNIVGSVERVTDIVGEIATAAQQQSIGINQIDTAVS